MKSVLETRKTPDGLIRRRYEREGQQRLTTYEIPAAVLKSIGMKRVVEQMAAWERGEAQRKRTAEIDSLVKEGIKPTAIAHQLGVTDQAVRMRRKKLSETPPPCPKPH